MAQWFKRSAAGFLALLFLVTSLSLTILVVWAMRQENSNKTAKENLQQALQQAQQSTKENKLEGTKLSSFTPVAKVDSLQKIDTIPGNGDEVKTGDTVTAHYTGAVASTGIIFQSSLDSGQPIPFSLGQVIQGWAEGVPGMKVGGTRRLLIPAALAYGASPPAGSGIPANSDLVFDIQLVKIN